MSTRKVREVGRILNSRSRNWLLSFFPIVMILRIRRIFESMMTTTAIVPAKVESIAPRTDFNLKTAASTPMKMVAQSYWFHTPVQYSLPRAAIFRIISKRYTKDRMSFTIMMVPYFS